MTIDDIKPNGRYTMKTTLEVLGIKSHNTLNKYVEHGFITKHYRLPRGVFFLGSDITNFFKLTTII